MDQQFDPVTAEDWFMVSPPIKEVLAQNLNALMAASEDLGTTMAVEQATAKRSCRIGKSTVHRIRKAETPVNLEYVEVLAKVFGVAPWQLLIPGLDPKNPQVLRSMNPAEESLYKRMRDLAKEINDLPNEDAKP